MRGSSLLPKQLRSFGSNDGWLNRTTTSKLLAVSHLACQHPIHTLVVIALLASTSYIGLLQESLFDTTGQAQGGTVDVNSLLNGGRTLELSSKTFWRWQVEDNRDLGDLKPVSDAKLFSNERSLIFSQETRHLALTTFVFPDSSTTQVAPLADAVPIPANVTAKALPSTSNLLAPISHDSSLAFSMVFSEVSDFLKSAQEIPGRLEVTNGNEHKIWMMKATRCNGIGSRRTYRVWLSDGWTSFVDLLKVKPSSTNPSVAY